MNRDDRLLMNFCYPTFMEDYRNLINKINILQKEMEVLKEKINYLENKIIHQQLKMYIFQRISSL